MIWLIGENAGKTCNNNAFYFWKYTVSVWDNTKKYEPYYVVQKTTETERIYKTLSEVEKKFFVWYDTKKHINLYKKSYFNIISLSMLDVVPTKYKKGRYKKNVKRIIHLTHGINFLKKGDMKSSVYNNNLTRLYAYNENLLEAKLEEVESYQLKYNPYLLPRHEYLLKSEQKPNNEIVWFLTWRKYKSTDAAEFQKYIEYILTSNELKEVLKKNKLKLKLVIHHLSKMVLEDLEDEQITIVYQNDIDFTEEILHSKMVITDYSSVVFEYALLNKPIIFFAPDKDLYDEERGFYIEYNDENLNTKISSSLSQLVEAIDAGGDKNTVIHKLIQNKDKQAIINGASSKFILEDLENLIENRYTFIVYNIFGIGGTISSTLTLASQVIKNGGMADIISLRKTTANKKSMPSLNIKTIVNVQRSRSKKAKIKQRVLRFGSPIKSLKYDPIFVKRKNFFGTLASKRLFQVIDNIDTGKLVSTRESFHPLILNNKFVGKKDKLYFFHLDVYMLAEEKSLVKCLTDRLGQDIKSLFVSKLSYDSIDEVIPLNNKKILYNAYNPKQRENKYDYKKHGKINICYVGRLSKDKRIDLLPEIIKELPEDKFYFHIFGMGDYKEVLEKELKETGKYNYHMHGFVIEPEEAYNIADISIVLSDYESFGMVYIESFFNNVPVLTKPIAAAVEVLDGCENVFYENNQDLIKKLNDETFIKELKESIPKNKKIIEEKFGVDIMYDKFIKIVEEE